MGSKVHIEQPRLHIATEMLPNSVVWKVCRVMKLTFRIRVPVSRSRSTLLVSCSPGKSLMALMIQLCERFLDSVFLGMRRRRHWWPGPHISDTFTLSGRVCKPWPDRAASRLGQCPWSFRQRRPLQAACLCTRLGDLSCAPTASFKAGAQNLCKDEHLVVERSNSARGPDAVERTLSSE